MKKDMQSWIVLLCLFKACIIKHVELQNVARTSMDQPQEGTKNSYSPKQIKRHGVGKLIGNVELIYLSIYLDRE
jgi:hypothetical protein